MKHSKLFKEACFHEWNARKESILFLGLYDIVNVDISVSSRHLLYVKFIWL